MKPYKSGEGNAMDATRATRVMEALQKLYPEAKPELNFRNPYETLIATILSAQCTDKRVNQVTSRLFPMYPDAFAMAKLEPEELEQILLEVRLISFHGMRGQKLLIGPKIKWMRHSNL